MVPRIEFDQPKLRVEDWRVKLNGRTVGSVWRCDDGYLVSVLAKQSAPTQEATFAVAKKQLRRLAAVL